MKKVNCDLWNECKEEHVKAPDKYSKLYVVGNLFEGKRLCLWCLLHLEDLSKKPLTDNDVAELQMKRQRFPNYAKVIDRIGRNKIEFELKNQWFEVDPDSTPTHWKQTIPDLTVKGRRIPNV
jgi:hypothetical protein